MEISAAGLFASVGGVITLAFLGWLIHGFRVLRARKRMNIVSMYRSSSEPVSPNIPIKKPAIQTEYVKWLLDGNEGTYKDFLNQRKNGTVR